ncbi:low-specificity L-threonine aldolase [Halobacillus sp. A5]|uniref:low-specificity L-threonine aldolase n=1 Tax=Halobacillus sp. A5 TaxID=2880263 RepID=UPI0020A61EE4|nr:low-specificity L-threonine aldolase [Halobacillus sp. A5]MCP3027000.1 low-specificity L-threonine aldolase [Halobacillus sp. A5]
MIDLRSDTVTRPTPEMRQAAFDVEVGDDVYGEDTSVLKLEETAARMLGKEAALFVTSGTQGNQIAALTHCQPGDEVLVEASTHLFLYEGAAMSALAGVQPRTIEGVRGAMDPEDVRAAVRPDDIHFPKTGMICVENTHNKAGGAVVSLGNMQAVYEVAREYGIPVHLDGARLFNAVAASGISVEHYASQADTVQFCLSKGLGAPVGSIITGSAEFIQRARKWRKRLGGGLRQAGVIAEPGYVALTQMTGRLADDHENARYLADSINQIDGLRVEGPVDTNIVLVNVADLGLQAEHFLAELKKEGVLAVPFGRHTVRFVTHFDVSREHIKTAVDRVNAISWSV